MPTWRKQRKRLRRKPQRRRSFNSAAEQTPAEYYFSTDYARASGHSRFWRCPMSAEGDAKKRLAAQAALDYVIDGAVIGVGTGSTGNFFIEALIPLRDRVRAA